MDNYDATVDPDRPLGYRHLRPAETLEVDPATGEIARSLRAGAGRLHRERPGPPGGALPRGVGADRRRPAGTADRRAARAATRPRSATSAGGSSWPTSRSSAAPAATRTGSTADSGDITDHARAPAGRRRRELLAGQVDPLRLGPVHPADRRRTRRSGCASPRPRASSTAPAARRPPPGRRPTRTSATSSTTPARTGAPGSATRDSNRPGRRPCPAEIYAGVRSARTGSRGYLDDGCDGLVRRR